MGIWGAINIKHPSVFLWVLVYLILFVCLLLIPNLQSSCNTLNVSATGVHPYTWATGSASDIGVFQNLKCTNATFYIIYASFRRIKL